MDKGQVNAGTDVSLVSLCLIKEFQFQLFLTADIPPLKPSVISFNCSMILRKINSSELTEYIYRPSYFMAFDIFM